MARPDHAAEPSPRARAARLLGISEDAGGDEVRRAFRRAALRLHPDRHPHAPTAERKRLERAFTEVTRACRLLGAGV
jgi:curved DNA-binding protein CbpA